MDLEIIILSKVSHTKKNKCHITSLMWASLVVSSKEFACHAGDVRDTSLIPGLGRSSAGGHGNPLQYSCLENPTDRGTWPTTVHRVTKNKT